MDRVEPKNRVVTAGSLRLNVYEWGKAEKPLLVLLHGLASTSHMFDLIAPLLAPDYHIIACDQRGHGLSDKPDSGYDFETIASDLDNLLKSLGLGDHLFALAGHSWGASTALYYAATRPSRVRRAILLDGGLNPITDSFASLEDMAPPQRKNGSLADVKRMIRENWLGEAWRPELEPLVLSIYDITNPNHVQPHLKLANHMQIAEALWNFRPADFYPRIQCPLLVVIALRTSQTPDSRLLALAEAAKNQAPRTQFVWMPDTIHDIPWQRPQELAGIMSRFLSNE